MEHHFFGSEQKPAWVYENSKKPEYSFIVGVTPSHRPWKFSPLINGIKKLKTYFPDQDGPEILAFSASAKLVPNVYGGLGASVDGETDQYFSLFEGKLYCLWSFDGEDLFEIPSEDAKKDWEELKQIIGYTAPSAV